jgi:uncharacterized membrane protein YphA (DoxX/SURF4 family)
MSIAYDIVGILLALILLASAVGKLTHLTPVVDNLTGLGVPLGMFPYLAACEITGAIGLVIGLWYPPLGTAAALGVVLYFVGAVSAHLRKSDFKGVPTAAIMLVAATTALLLQVTST